MIIIVVLVCLMIFLLLILFIVFYKFSYCISIEYNRSIILYTIYFTLFTFELPMAKGKINPFVKKKISDKSKMIMRVFTDVLLSNRTTYKIVKINTTVGIEDVVLNSICYGLLSILLSALPIVLNRFYGVEKVFIKLIPVFKRNILQISIKCIVGIKIVDIIIILFGDKIKGGGKIGTSN